MAEAPGIEDDTGEPLRNQALVEAMRAVSVDDTPARRALLFQLLLDSRLIVVTPSRPDRPGSRTATGGEHLDLVTLADADGSVLPVFTSPEAVVAWRPEGRRLRPSEPGRCSSRCRELTGVS